ncbi:MAG: asparagine synthase-related protein [Kovacikia sp.]
MQRIAGSYSSRSKPISQADHQIEPEHWTIIDGFKLPIRGPFTQAICNRGTAVLYVSQPGEVPLYISLTPGYIHWHEQELLLPKPVRIKQGCVVIWTPENCQLFFVEGLPRPPIRDPISKPEAIAQYQECIINAVRRRLNGRTRVAVAQSGGTDSLLLTWALLELGIEVVPLTVCTSRDTLDFVGAETALKTLGLKPILILIPPESLKALIYEAVLCLEHTESSNVRMAIGNILMARKCQELGIDLIFIGHGHDDVFGKGTLMKGVLAEQIGTPSEQWRDARIASTEATAGMMKMFSSTFRRYGVETRMPYYDAELLEWAFSQPIEVLPIEFKKQFVHTVFQACFPINLSDRHSVGYLKGAGLGLKGDLFKQFPLIIEDKAIRSTLAGIKRLSIKQRISLHDTPANSRVVLDPQ